MRDTRIKRYERAIDQAWKNSQIWRPSTAEGQNRNQPREYGSHCTHRQETKTNQRNHTYMTPRDDGLSGQPKKRKMGKCRERPTLQDMAEKVSANSMWHTRPARCGAAEAAAREYGRHGMSRSVWWLCPPSVHLLYDVIDHCPRNQREEDFPPPPSQPSSVVFFQPPTHVAAAILCIAITKKSTSDSNTYHHIAQCQRDRVGVVSSSMVAAGRRGKIFLLLPNKKKKRRQM